MIGSFMLKPVLVCCIYFVKPCLPVQYNIYLIMCSDVAAYHCIKYSDTTSKDNVYPYLLFDTNH